MRYAIPILLLLAPVAAYPQTPLETVDRVDLDRYLGKWYEIASYPAWLLATVDLPIPYR